MQSSASSSTASSSRTLPQTSGSFGQAATSRHDVLEPNHGETADEWTTDRHGIRYRRYRGEESDMAAMMGLVDEDLSEP